MPTATTVECNICHKPVKARGLATHKRIVHQPEAADLPVPQLAANGSAPAVAPELLQVAPQPAVVLPAPTVDMEPTVTITPNTTGAVEVAAPAATVPLVAASPPASASLSKERVDTIIFDLPPPYFEETKEIVRCLMPRHGEVPLAQFVVKENSDSNYRFCAHCFGEWLKRTFPVS